MIFQNQINKVDFFSILIFFKDFEAILDVPVALLFRRNFFIDYDPKFCRIEFGEECIAIERSQDLGHVHPVKQIRL